MSERVRFRGLGCSAVTALAVSCILASVASARQQGTTNTATQKSATTAPKHYSAAGKATSKSSTHPVSTSKRSARRKKSTHVRGQQKIDSARARTIQQALIREHYLTGDATGTWNQESEEAMRRYQEDHGWQTKEVPDSRALIKLGLGPTTDHLLNPESAMTTSPESTRSESPLPTSHTATPAAAPPTQSPAQIDPPGPQ
jgi:Putative peptidoglycan binding domain